KFCQLLSRSEVDRAKGVAALSRQDCSRTIRPHLPLSIIAMLTPSEVQLLDQQFSQEPVEAVLRWAWERFGPRAAIGSSFQGAGLVLMHVAKEHNLRFPVFTLDTGLLFEETRALKKRLEDFFGCD